MRYGISGIKIIWAPPAIPASRAIQPAFRPHYLQNHHPIMTSSGGLQTVQRIAGNLDSCLIAECIIGFFEIIINGLWHTNHRKSLFEKIYIRFQESLPRQ